MNRILVPIVLIIVLVAGACSSEPQGSNLAQEITDTSDVVLSEDPTAVVLQIDVRVNQPDPFPIAGAYPPFTLYGDGTIVYRDRNATPTALPPLMQARVSPTGIARLLTEAVEADVFGSPDTGYDRTIADASAVYVRAALNGRSVDYSIGDNDQLDDFAKRLEQQWPEIVGDEIVADPQPYDFESVLVIAGKDRAGLTTDVATPLPFDLRQADEVRTRGFPLRCVAVSSTEFDEIRSSAATIDTPNGSTWRSGTATGTPGADLWYVVFRPLLPHETGCDLIADQ